MNHEDMEFGHMADATGGRALPGISTNRVQMAVQPRQEAQGTVTLQTIDNPIDTTNRRNLKHSDLAVLHKLGWDKPYLPDRSQYDEQKRFLDSDIAKYDKLLGK